MKKRNKKEDYLWFCKTLGEDLKITQDNLITNRPLNQKDITLDCRVIDLDGVGFWEGEVPGDEDSRGEYF